MGAQLYNQQMIQVIEETIDAEEYGLCKIWRRGRSPRESELTSLTVSQST